MGEDSRKEKDVEMQRATAKRYVKEPRTPRNSPRMKTNENFENILQNIKGYEKN